MIARIRSLLSLLAKVDAPFMVVVPDEVVERLLATPGACLRSRFEVFVPIETDVVTYAVTQESEVV